MSEVLAGINLKREEITMAVHRMQNLQFLSDTGEERREYSVLLKTFLVHRAETFFGELLVYFALTGTRL